MNSDTIVFLAQTVILPATLVVNLVVTIIIAMTSHRTSQRLTALEMLRGIDQQWQTLNAAILAQPTIQRHIQNEDVNLSERTIVRRNVAFYILNVALQLARGRDVGLVDTTTALRLNTAYAEFLSQLRPEVDDIIAESAVYRSELHDLILHLSRSSATDRR
jgi:hypothetical protein